MSTAQIQWRDAEPDVAVLDFSDLLRQCSWRAAIAFIENGLNGVSVYVAQSCEQAIESHLATENAELGGLLVGRVFKAPFKNASDYYWVTFVEKSIPSTEYKNSSVSLRMGTEVWTRASESMTNRQMVVGWYHSHPDLGVFFSGTDRATQAAFFSRPYALGVVIDPVRRMRKCFFGATSQELDSIAITTN